MGYYCVVEISSLDYGDTSVKLFQNEGLAQAYIHDIWTKYMKEELDNDNYSNIDKGGTYCDIDYAVITWNDGCRVEFIESYAEF